MIGKVDMVYAISSHVIGMRRHLQRILAVCHRQSAGCKVLVHDREEL